MNNCVRKSNLDEIFGPAVGKEIGQVDFQMIWKKTGQVQAKFDCAFPIGALPMGVDLFNVSGSRNFILEFSRNFTNVLPLEVIKLIFFC